MKAYIDLMRPRTLAASLAPVCLGAAFAYYMGVTYESNIPLALLNTLLIFIVVLVAQIIANMWNEYEDYKSGLDHGQKIGNAGSITGGILSAVKIMQLIRIAMIIPVVIGFYLAATITWWYVPVGGLCIAISFLYSGGPKPISRTPFGELSSGLAMGLAIVCVVGYAWTRNMTPVWLIPAIPSILLIGSIMLTNNIRDMENDSAHGRRTLPIVVGRTAAISIMSIQYWFNFLWIIAWIWVGVLPIWCLLALLAAIPAYKVVTILLGPGDVFTYDTAMSFTAMAAILYHLLWSIGLIIGRAVI